jgi:hypothetical protein
MIGVIAVWAFHGLTKHEELGPLVVGGGDCNNESVSSISMCGWGFSWGGSEGSFLEQEVVVDTRIISVGAGFSMMCFFNWGGN